MATLTIADETRIALLAAEVVQRRRHADGVTNSGESPFLTGKAWPDNPRGGYVPRASLCWEAAGGALEARADAVRPTARYASLTR